ncbi:MAG: hypothetical protein M3161_05980 [Actinomycetota bacterium]|nr:hypothetical protein [Actinomycetota bacterium]
MKTVLAALGMVVVLAGPAAAQARDPFDPVIQPGTATTGTETTGQVPTTTTGERAPGVPAARTDTLGNTGADVETWLVAAFAALVAGAGALTIGRLYSKPLV